jgi:uncharacterized protein (TIGR02246 family)
MKWLTAILCLAVSPTTVPVRDVFIDSHVIDRATQEAERTVSRHPQFVSEVRDLVTSHRQPLGTSRIAWTEVTPNIIEGEAEVRQAVATFFEGLANFDWQKFRASFAEDATFFSPGLSSDPSSRAHRVTGRDDIVAGFESLFKDYSRQNGPPYLNIQPKDIAVQMLGESVAVVTLHLEAGKRVSRRTLVLQQRQGIWLIVHIHASAIQLPG